MFLFRSPYYLKKSDARSYFKRLRFKFALSILALAVVAPMSFSFLISVNLQEYVEHFKNPNATLPFLLVQHHSIAAILIALGMLIAGFVYFSNLPQKMFEKRLSNFESTSDDELIKTSKLMGPIALLFLSLLVGFVVLGVIYFAGSLLELRDLIIR